MDIYNHNARGLSRHEKLGKNQTYYYSNMLYIYIYISPLLPLCFLDITQPNISKLKNYCINKLKKYCIILYTV